MSYINRIVDEIIEKFGKQDSETAAHNSVERAETPNFIKERFQAEELYGNGDYTAAFKLWMFAAEHGDATAQLCTGLCFLDGSGVDCDDDKAVEWLEKAALQGEDSAEYYLASCYENGVGVEENKELAAYWYGKSAEQGNYFAQLAYGKCYLRSRS